MEKEKMPRAERPKGSGEPISKDPDKRLAAIEARIDEIKGSDPTDEEREAIQAKRAAEHEEKRSQLEQELGPLSEESEQLIAARQAEALQGTAEAENRELDRLMQEKHEIELGQTADKLLDFMAEVGLRQSPQDREASREMLLSDELADLSADEVRQRLGFDREAIERDKALMKRIAERRGEAAELMSDLLRSSLLSAEYKHMLLASDLRSSGEAVIDEEPIDLAAYGDEELRELGIQALRDHIRSIVSDPDVSVMRGEGWNALVSDPSPYVLKTERWVKGHTWAQRLLAEQYPAARAALGSEFLLKQAVLASNHDATSDRLHVLQERLSPDAKPIKMTYDKDSLEPAVILSDEARAMLAVPEARKKLDTFLERARALQDRGMYVDFLGENLFVVPTEEGADIKLIDYGMSDRIGHAGTDYSILNERFMQALARELDEPQQS